MYTTTNSRPLDKRHHLVVTTQKSSLAQDKSNPEGGAASHKTKGTKKGGEKNQPISQFIEGGQGSERGTIECFCFVYKERVLRRSLLKDKRGTSPPTTNSRKAKPRKEKLEGPRNSKHRL